MIESLGVFVDLFNEYIDQNELQPTIHHEIGEILKKIKVLLDKID